MRATPEVYREEYLRREQERRRRREELREQVLGQVRATVARLAPQEPAVRAVYLFGSLLQPGRFRPDSDVNLRRSLACARWVRRQRSLPLYPARATVSCRGRKSTSRSRVCSRARQRRLSASGSSQSTARSTELWQNISRREARKVPDIGRRDQHIWLWERHGLTGEDHVSIQRLVSCGGLPLLPSFRPQESRLSHGGCGQRYVVQQTGQRIQPLDALQLFGTEQLTSYFIIGDLGQDDPGARGDQHL